MNTIAGKVIQLLDEVSGENERGAWVRSGFVVMPTTDTSSPLCIECVGEEKCALVRSLSVGQAVLVDYRCESRQYQDKWFTSAKLVRLGVVDMGKAAAK